MIFSLNVFSCSSMKSTWMGSSSRWAFISSSIPSTALSLTASFSVVMMARGWGRALKASLIRAMSLRLNM